MFFGDAFEVLGEALDPVRQSVVVLDRQRTYDLVLPARCRIAESRLVIDVRAGG
jgi:hypothetical protein